METPPCPHCRIPKDPSEKRSFVVRYGFFRRNSDQSDQRRYRCKGCRRTFSDASFSICYRQKKRHLNGTLMEFLASASSQRRLAMNLKVNRKTVVRKFLFLGHVADHLLKEDRNNFGKSKVVEFDDLETFEHSKLKPLSVCAVVEHKSRRILGFNVAQMPANGPLAKKSRAKYGKRKDQRRKAREGLFSELRAFIDPNAVIKSDENPHYGPTVETYFPNAKHLKFKGKRGCVVGQGELKAARFDPLFSLNHTFAMFRANVNRLARRTWNTTKKRDRLHLHIAIYALFHNWKLIPRDQRPASPLELLRASVESRDASATAKGAS